MKAKSKALTLNLNSVPPISKEMSFCLASGIKVYPVNKKGKWFIEVDNNGKIKTFEKAITEKEISESAVKTYQFYYNRLKELENGK